MRVVEYNKRTVEAMEEVLSKQTGVASSVKSPLCYGIVIAKTNPQNHKPHLYDYKVLVGGDQPRTEWFFASGMRFIS